MADQTMDPEILMKMAQAMQAGELTLSRDEMNRLGPENVNLLFDMQKHVGKGIGPASDKPSVYGDNPFNPTAIGNESGAGLGAADLATMGPIMGKGLGALKGVGQEFMRNHPIVSQLGLSAILKGMGLSGWEAPFIFNNAVRVGSEGAGHAAPSIIETLLGSKAATAGAAPAAGDLLAGGAKVASRTMPMSEAELAAAKAGAVRPVPTTSIDTLLSQDTASTPINSFADLQKKLTTQELDHLASIRGTGVDVPNNPAAKLLEAARTGGPQIVRSPGGWSQVMKNGDIVPLPLTENASFADAVQYANKLPVNQAESGASAVTKGVGRKLPVSQFANAKGVITPNDNAAIGLSPNVRVTGVTEEAGQAMKSARVARRGAYKNSGGLDKGFKNAIDNPTK